MVIRNTIRRLRFDEDEMTQQELADKVGVTRQTINAIETGRYDPGLPLAFAIAKVFETSIEAIFLADD